MNVVPGHVIIQRMFSLAADHTVAECGWLYLTSVMESGKNVTAPVEHFHRVNQQDFYPCERCQPAMGSKIYAKGGYCSERAPHQRFHDWTQEVVGDVIPTR